MSRSRPRCLILDAGPVIGLHELGVWGAFVECYEVVVPRIVCDDEALFHSRDAVSGFTDSIDLAGDARVGRVTVAEATLEAVERVLRRFTDAIELHDGELEALALLTEDQGYREHVFCTADAAAIQGSCMIGLADRCQSLEELLILVGLGRRVAWRYSRRFMDEHKRAGAVRRVTGFGLDE